MAQILNIIGFFLASGPLPYGQLSTLWTTLEPVEHHNFGLKYYLNLSGSWS